jgi:hypothetical protein
MLILFFTSSVVPNVDLQVPLLLFLPYRSRCDSCFTGAAVAAVACKGAIVAQFA